MVIVTLFSLVNSGKAYGSPTAELLLSTVSLEFLNCQPMEVGMFRTLVAAVTKATDRRKGLIVVHALLMSSVHRSGRTI